RSHRRQLVGQPRLADASLTGQHDDRPTSAVDGRQAVAQLRQFAMTADEAGPPARHSKSLSGQVRRATNGTGARYSDELFELALQVVDLVAQTGGVLEAEVDSGIVHLLLERLNET